MTFQLCYGMIFCLTIAICLAGCSASSDNLKNGKKSAREGDWDKSVEFLEKALQESPNDAEIKLMSTKAKWEASMEHLKKGHTLLDNKFYNAAIKEFQKSIAYFPANQKASAFIKKTRTLKEANHYVLWMGTFDDQSRFKLVGEIYIDEKPDAYDMAGDHPRLTGEEFMTSMQS